MTPIVNYVDKMDLKNLNQKTQKQKNDMVEKAFLKYRGHNGINIPSFPLWKKTHSQLPGIQGDFKKFLTMKKMNVPGRPQFRCTVTGAGMTR